jgi:WD40 repeat protein
VESVAYSPDGRRFISGASDKTVRLWDTQSGAQLLCLRGHEGNVHRVGASPDSSRIISAARDDAVRVWDTQSGAQLLCLRGQTASVWDVAYSPDGLRIYTDADFLVRVWDAESGEYIETIRGTVRSINAADRDPPWLASASMGGETRIESRKTREVVAWFPADLEHIALHPGGHLWAGNALYHGHLYFIVLEGA